MPSLAVVTDRVSASEHIGIHQNIPFPAQWSAEFPWSQIPGHKHQRYHEAAWWKRLSAPELFTVAVETRCCSETQAMMKLPFVKAATAGGALIKTGKLIHLKLAADFFGLVGDMTWA